MKLLSIVKKLQNNNYFCILSIVSVVEIIGVRDK